MAATKALSCGNWLVAYNHLEALPVWDLMPRRTEVTLDLINVAIARFVCKDDGFHAGMLLTGCGTIQVLLMLKHRVQSEALRSYLFAFGLHYSSISLDQLAAIFQQPPKKVGFLCHCCLHFEPGNECCRNSQCSVVVC